MLVCDKFQLEKNHALNLKDVQDAYRDMDEEKKNYTKIITEKLTKQ